MRARLQHRRKRQGQLEARNTDAQQGDTVMLLEALVGSVVSVCNIVIHALLMTAVVRVVQVAAARHRLLPTSHLIAVMVAAVSVLMAAHTCEVLVWSLAYAIVGAAPAGADLV